MEVNQPVPSVACSSDLQVYSLAIPRNHHSFSSSPQLLLILCIGAIDAIPNSLVFSLVDRLEATYLPSILRLQHSKWFSQATAFARRSHTPSTWTCLHSLATTTATTASARAEAHIVSSTSAVLCRGAEYRIPWKHPSSKPAPPPHSEFRKPLQLRANG
jgi:hypothetical protein